LSSTHDEDSSMTIVAPTAYVVERVAGQVAPGQLTLENAEHVENLIEQVFGELQRESGPMPPVVGQRIRMAARAELLEFGPLGALLDDPGVTEIAASGAGHLTVVRGAQQSQGMPFCASGSLERAIERLCVSEGAPIAEGESSARRQLSSCGFDLELLRGPLSPQGGVVRLRRRERVAVGLEDLVRLGTISRAMATLFQQCVVARANILVVGGPRSGASELMSALATASPGDRALLLSQAEELADADGRIMPLNATSDSELAEMLSQLATLPGHRLVVDDLLRGERGVATLQAVFEGADGVVARLEARAIERGVAQLCAHTAMLRPGLSVNTIADGVIAAFDMVVEVGRLRDGRSRVLRVAELRPGESLAVAADDIFSFSVERVATGGAVEGSFTPTGRQPRFAAELRTRGVRMDSGIFGRAARAPHP
jgi:pilus assembly protein CpaF